MQYSSMQSLGSLHSHLLGGQRPRLDLPRRPRRPPPLPLCRQKKLPPPPKQRWGNSNRLAPRSAPDRPQPARQRRQWEQQDASGSALPAGLRDFWGRVCYQYYNWRQDTSSDLLLFTVNNTLLFLVLGAIQQNLIAPLDAPPPPPQDDRAAAADGGGGVPPWWSALYRIAHVVLGQELPDEGSLPSQLFSVLVAVLGLASFALVLALIEQVVLEVLESNVKRGSPVYESGHTLVLAWCESARDVGQVTRMLTELCQAYRGEGGTVVVVLTQREKLEMEGIFREAVPPEERHGSTFVFRQGSPLDPAALLLVAAPAARAVIIAGYSRSSMDSDALVLRTAVLLDELLSEEERQEEAPPETAEATAAGAGPGPRSKCGSFGPVVVAQIKTSDVLPLLMFSCSERVVPVPTSTANALRFARLLRHPIVATLSHMLTDHSSKAHGGIGTFPELEGVPFGELQFYFPHAVVLGLLNQQTNYCQLNPPPGQRVAAGDELVMLRPGALGRRYAPLEEAVQADPGPAWDPAAYLLKTRDEQPLGSENAYKATRPARSKPSPPLAFRTPDFPAAPRSGSIKRGRVPAAEQRQRQRQRGSNGGAPSNSSLYCLPLSWDVLSDSLLQASELLVAGWAGDSSMWELLRQLDHGRHALPPGSQVTLVNTQPWGAVGARVESSGIQSLRVTHVQADPRNRTALASAIDIARYKAAIVVCDGEWFSAPEQARRLSQGDMLRLDAAVLMVQLNLRLMLEDQKRPDISIITEKLTYTGQTRFEDTTRLPLGIAVNTSSFSARLLTQVACEPLFLKPYLELGAESDLAVQDASGLAALGEELSYWELQARAASVRQVLMGYYRIPASPEEPLEVVVNPQGSDARSERVVWNSGDSRCKLIVMAPNSCIAGSVSSVSSLDGIELSAKKMGV